ncbi:MAG: hypothetical protein RLY86_1007 [Pseudomonadota bacterium]|jgi:aldose 1-epimerase
MNGRAIMDGEMTGIELTRGDLRLGVDPARGGVLTYLRSQGPGGPIDWLRPATPGFRLPEMAGSFPLVPFSNRIAQGRFVVDGRRVSLPANRPNQPHAIHGFGWDSTWTIGEQGPDRLTLTHAVDGDGPWPWAYRAWQEIILDDDGVGLTLAVENRSGAPMPAGIGQHPYFPTAGLRGLRARVAAYHLSGPDMLPTDRVPDHPGVVALATGGALPIGLDGVFDGWDGRADLVWEDRRLTLTADPVFGRLVLYSPPGADYFCLEPVSHMTDAHNRPPALAADQGLRLLPPGAALLGKVRLTPSRD